MSNNITMLNYTLPQTKLWNKFGSDTLNVVNVYSYRKALSFTHLAEPGSLQVNIYTMNTQNLANYSTTYTR